MNSFLVSYDSDIFPPSGAVGLQAYYTGECLWVNRLGALVGQLKSVRHLVTHAERDQMPSNTDDVTCCTPNIKTKGLD